MGGTCSTHERCEKCVKKCSTVKLNSEGSGISVRNVGILRHHYPEDRDLNLHSPENFKSPISH